MSVDIIADSWLHASCSTCTVEIVDRGVKFLPAIECTPKIISRADEAEKGP